ncbi:MAG: von Willebrand factor type A domain-containing protein [Oscillospiraceae bacterium]|nr:von Willebrand factor type A domain-containing protein [Oscillospiraceae bacterium]
MNHDKRQETIRDSVYGEIAARYVERYGAVLQRELFESGAPARGGAFGSVYDAAGTAGAVGETGGRGGRSGRGGRGGTDARSAIDRDQGSGAPDGRGDGAGDLDTADGGGAESSGGGWVEAGARSRKTEAGERTKRAEAGARSGQAKADARLSQAEAGLRPGQNGAGWANSGMNAGINAGMSTGKNAGKSTDRGADRGADKSADSDDSPDMWPGDRSKAPDGRIFLKADASTDEWIIEALATERRKRALIRFSIAIAAVACLAASVLFSGLPEMVKNVWETQIASKLSQAPPGGAEAMTTGGALQTTSTASGLTGNALLEDGQPDGPGDSEGDVEDEVGIIPLDFPIRSGYSIVSVIQDAGRTVYFIANEKQDNIVLTVRRGSLPADIAAPLTGIGIGGADVYLAYNEDYSLLLFERDNLVYELTCRYDVNTLMDFCGFENHAFARGVLNPRLGEGGQKSVAVDYMMYIPLKSGTASYSDIRRRIAGGEAPPPGSVVTEEAINYFPPERDYSSMLASMAAASGGGGEEGGQDAGEPDAAGQGAGGTDAGAPDEIDNGSSGEWAQGDHPFQIYYEMGASPLHEDRAIAYVHIMAQDFDWLASPPSNITMLIDTSSTMYSFDKLPMVKEAILHMAEKMDEQDRMSIVVYDGDSEVLLDNAEGGDTAPIRSALDDMSAGIYTYYGSGLQTAYTIAQKNFIEGGNNLVITITDTDDGFGLNGAADALDDLVAQYSDVGIEFRAIAVGALAGPEVDARYVEFIYATTLAEIKQALVNELTSDSYLIAGGARAFIEFNPANVTSYSLFGYDDRRSAYQEQIYTWQDMDHIYAGDSIVLLFELELLDPGALTGTGGGETGGGGAEGAGAEGAGADAGESAAAVEYADELFEIRIRYTAAGEFANREFAKAATYDDVKTENSADFHLACSVAVFCGSLKGDGDMGASIDLAESLAVAGANASAGGGAGAGSPGEGADARRAAYIELIRQYRNLVQQ